MVIVFDTGLHKPFPVDVNLRVTLPFITSWLDGVYVVDVLFALPKVPLPVTIDHVPPVAPVTVPDKFETVETVPQTT